MPTIIIASFSTEQSGSLFRLFQSFNPICLRSDVIEVDTENLLVHLKKIFFFLIFEIPRVQLLPLDNIFISIFSYKLFFYKK